MKITFQRIQVLSSYKCLKHSALNSPKKSHNNLTQYKSIINIRKPSANVFPLRPEPCLISWIDSRTPYKQKCSRKCLHKSKSHIRNSIFCLKLQLIEYTELQFHWRKLKLPRRRKEKWQWSQQPYYRGEDRWSSKKTLKGNRIPICPQSAV